MDQNRAIILVCISTKYYTRKVKVIAIAASDDCRLQICTAGPELVNWHFMKSRCSWILSKTKSWLSSKSMLTISTFMHRWKIATQWQILLCLSFFQLIEYRTKCKQRSQLGCVSSNQPEKIVENGEKEKTPTYATTQCQNLPARNLSKSALIWSSDRAITSHSLTLTIKL